MSYFVVIVNRLNGRSSRPIDGGEFKERNDAIAAAQRVIDAWLCKNYKPGINASNIIEKYLEVGEVPSIFGDQNRTIGTGFDYTEYAIKRANEFCVPAKG